MGSQQQEKHVLVERGRGVYSVKSKITLPLVFTLCAFLCSSISMLNAVSSYTLFDCNLFGKKGTSCADEKKVADEASNFYSIATDSDTFLVICKIIVAYF